MDWKFWMGHLTNPQNGWTKAEAEQYCRDREQSEKQESSDFWTDATGLSPQTRAEILRSNKPQNLSRNK